MSNVKKHEDQLILLGTIAGPNVSLQRPQAGSLLVIDEVPYLVDCGYGTLRQVASAKIDYRDIRHIFITHLHDDHTIDVAALLSLQWTRDFQSRQTDIFGPYGTSNLVDGAIAFMKANVDIRTSDEGGRNKKPAERFIGHDFKVSSETIQVFKDERVRITAIENSHFPTRATKKMPYRSVSYRFDTQSRSIVFSGDTAYSKNTALLAHNADIFVCEIITEASFARLSILAKEETLKGNVESAFRHTVETHSRPGDVARMAKEANVKVLVLNHMVTESESGSILENFINDVRADFKGQVIVGQELMVL